MLRRCSTWAERESEHIAMSAESIEGGRDLAMRFIASLKSSDESLVTRGRWIRTRCRLGFDRYSILLDVDHGCLTTMDPIALMASWDFSICATVTGWSALWEPMPLPGWHDIFALAKRGELRMEGNLHPLLANLQYFKDVLNLPRMESRDGSL